MAKNGKKPSVAQMNELKDSFGLDPKQWLIVKWTTWEAVIQSRKTGELRTLERS